MADLTIYTKGYDDVQERIVKYDARLVKTFRDMNVIDKLIGINSLHMVDGQPRHHCFLEWDRPNTLYNLDRCPGIVTMSTRGWHVIHQHSLTLEELVLYQQQAGCCEGFINQTEARGYACLRVCPKDGEKLKVLRCEDTTGSIDDIYERYMLLVSMLNDEYDFCSAIERAKREALKEVQGGREEVLAR